jgi:hypothetical protein
MGNFASRVHSKEDGKVYNILPLGDMPTVVFGRVIRENSVPGMQYYFPDGWVKWHVEGSSKTFEHVTPYAVEEQELGEDKWGTPCIFTIPDNFDYSKLSDVEYVKQFCRKAQNLNAKTTSPYYVIENGHIKCIKPLDAPGKYVVVTCKRRKKIYNDEPVYRKVNSVCGEVSMSEGERFSDFLNGHDGHIENPLLGQTKNKPNKFTLIPVGRVKYKVKYENSGLQRVKYNTTGERHEFIRTAKWYNFEEGIVGGWKLKEV